MYARYLGQVPPDEQTTLVTCAGIVTFRPELSVIVTSEELDDPDAPGVVSVHPAVTRKISRIPRVSIRINLKEVLRIT